MMYNNSGRTSQETHYISAIKPSRLMFYRETFVAYRENHTKQHAEFQYVRGESLPALRSIQDCRSLRRSVRPAVTGDMKTWNVKSVLVYNFRCSPHSRTYKIIQQNLKCIQEILFLFVIVMTMISIVPNIFSSFYFLLSCSFYHTPYWHRLSVLSLTLTDGMKYALASLRSANL
jgi:hypothetical protein